MAEIGAYKLQLMVAQLEDVENDIRVLKDELREIMTEAEDDDEPHRI